MSKVIPSTSLSFPPYYSHSFRITVIPSESLSFHQDYCHSFPIIVICHSEWLLYPFIPKGWENWLAEPAIFASTNKNALLEMISPYCGCGLLLPCDWIRLHRGPLFYLSTCTREALVDSTILGCNEVTRLPNHFIFNVKQ